jgi:hypothetical protein
MSFFLRSVRYSSKSRSTRYCVGPIKKEVGLMKLGSLAIDTVLIVSKKFIYCHGEDPNQLEHVVVPQNMVHFHFTPNSMAQK